jgi:hypothetical protein
MDRSGLTYFTSAGIRSKGCPANGDMCTATRSSRQNRPQDSPGHVRQPEILARVAVGQPRVVDAYQVQDGGVVVVDRAGPAAI